MRPGRSFAFLLTIFAALPVLDAQAAVPTPGQTAQASQIAPIVVHDARILTKEQFATLPDAAVVNARGGRTTAGALRAKQRANELARLARIETMKKAAATRIDAAAMRVQTEEKDRLDTTNARLRADASKVILGPLTIGPSTPTYTGPPEIQTAPASLEPGSYLPLSGRGFGSLPGKVVMKGLPTGDRVLTIESWKSTALGVTIPKNIVGVMDQNVRLQVIKRDGKLSADREVAFKATRETIYVLPTSVVKCHQDATDNNCDGRAGFFAVHTEDAFWEFDAVGCDEWKIPTLKNGWTIHSWEVTEMSNGGGRVGGMSRPSVGDTSGNWKACWTVPGTGGFSGNGAGYWGFYAITGPKGVPYK